MKLLRIVILGFVLVCCGQQQQLKAKVFERMAVSGNRLKIKYHYTIRNKDFTDSATLANTVVVGDSISVIINPSNPGKSLPDFSK